MLDFGIAKFLPRATQQHTADTGTGALVGTWQYMSPEQIRGEAAAPAWDLWALAVVAYEMLTGAHPFVGSAAAQVHSAVLAGRFTAVAAHLSDAPPAWQGFFERTFAPEPQRRPGSAPVLLSELERALA